MDYKKEINKKNNTICFKEITSLLLVEVLKKSEMPSVHEFLLFLIEKKLLCGD